MDKQVISRLSDSAEQSTSMRMKAILENVPRAIECVTEWALKAGFGERAVYEIQLAVDEACANVVDHAYRGAEPGDIEVSCRYDGQFLTIQVRDWGQGFDLATVKDPDLEAPLEERSLGGLGLFLVRQVMDEVQFTSHPKRGNELMMSKRLHIAG